VRRKLRIIILAAGLLAASIGVPVAMANTTITPAAGPTIAQLKARIAKGCTKVSKGNYKTDEEARATISICKAGSAFVWTSDMDVDCDGVRTSKCNERTDDAYQNQTSFETSKGRPFQADSTHYFVIPLPSSRFSYKSAKIKPGTTAAVIFKNKMVYAVFADEGPNDIIGEASYATNRDLGVNPDPNNGGTDGPVTFIVFPNAVPSPVESNSAITAKGSAAATAWVNS
jgi:Fungal chitosanase of glycosyl hydrolase group 75